MVPSRPGASKFGKWVPIFSIERNQMDGPTRCLSSSASYRYYARTHYGFRRLSPSPPCLAQRLCGRAAASEYCTQEQYERDHALIKGAISAGTIVKGPATLRDSILVQESMWFGMNYPQQIAFMQSFDCANGGPSGKHLLYMDVRSLATGKLIA